ncbi:hypothetical protein ACQY0O_001766 [Thecaphora frezii]
MERGGPGRRASRPTASPLALLPALLEESSLGAPCQTPHPALLCAARRQNMSDPASIKIEAGSLGRDVFSPHRRSFHLGGLSVLCLAFVAKVGKALDSVALNTQKTGSDERSRRFWCRFVAVSISLRLCRSGSSGLRDFELG